MNGNPDIGTLRHRLILEKPVAGVSDGAGGETVAWEPVAEIWAAVEPAGTGYGLHAGRLREEISHRVQIRFHDDVLAGMRFRFGERILNIVGAVNISERNEFLLLPCREER